MHRYFDKNLREGDRIRITGGTHVRKTGIIRKINDRRHWVNLEPVGSSGSGWIHEKFCERIAVRVLVDQVVVQEVVGAEVVVQEVMGAAPYDDVMEQEENEQEEVMEQGEDEQEEVMEQEADEQEEEQEEEQVIVEGVVEPPDLSTSSEESSASTRDGEELSMRFGEHLATRFLVDLLAQSIVFKEVRENAPTSVVEWQNLLRQRILLYRNQAGVTPEQAEGSHE
jgi:hypothetical protein